MDISQIGGFSLNLGNDVMPNPQGNVPPTPLE
jgi:hypothetical protein